MIITLSDTTSAKISSALLNARRSAGSPASGMVLTLIIVSDEDEYPAALEAAMAAGREHPSRILLVVSGNGRHTASLDAEVRIGEGTSGEVVVVRMRGPLADHPASVIRPLLLPDSPVVVWWPGSVATNRVASQSLAELSNRRITDAAASRQPRRELARRAEHVAPGDTDLSWTRLTPWRTLLAAALDQFPAKVTGAVVESERGNPSADLLVAWLEDRLRLTVKQATSSGPGITAVRMTTAAGDIAITRPDGLLASYAIPGQPNRLVALKRRTTADLVAEELRRMDHDVVYEATLLAFLRRSAGNRPARRAPQAVADDAGGLVEGPSAQRAAARRTARREPATKTAAKKTAAKKTAAKKTAKKAPAKKTAAKKTAAKKTAAKRAPAAKRTTAQRTTAQRTTARKAAR
ncbi:glucose-6-phosphate dehydrogenase assembly protein OpcA [Microlunatus endophyticus]|uniref:Glucose-6-phosphate dehydrogenase assembly protein OpcA n=1 Tax=Microlunatus endophyticus TaxID=1716077 RepID=A0A917SCW7_9ACTN|nr:glucose-6-phosphate dehydrogenase assembly protein OpcA [Microlunatus endophyticus]GGL68287.1 glucose-6-phosphate dehydrogenase assembly protein OpcA [Microlunatus endophyticus]